jgi:hypothetical protein
METCKSPRTVLIAADALGQACFKRRSKFSRKDFTDAQLFACLVLREHQNKSYRGLVALLQDTPDWCRDIGLKKVPDRNTLCRAFHRLVKPRMIQRMLDLSILAAQKAQRRHKARRRGKKKRGGRHATT